MNTTTKSPTIDERFASATNSRDLSLDARVIGDADYLIAAGWSDTRLGMALMRLRSEWDSAARQYTTAPCRPTRSQVHKLALANTAQGVPPGREDFDQARSTLEKEFEARNAEIIRPLKTLPAARYFLTFRAALDGAKDSETLAAQILLHWLSPRCPACMGRKIELKPWTDELNETPCSHCHGTGETQPPGGTIGKGLMNYLDSCLERGRESIRRRLKQ